MLAGRRRGLPGADARMHLAQEIAGRLALGRKLGLQRLQRSFQAVEALHDGFGDAGLSAPGLRVERCELQRRKRIIAPALELLRVHGSLHQQHGSRRTGAAAEQDAQQIGDRGRRMPRPGLLGSAAQRLRDLGRCARRASALARSGRNVGCDRDGGLAPEVGRADAHVLENLGRCRHAREGVQQMLVPHLPHAVERGDIVGRIAAREYQVIDLNRIVGGPCQGPGPGADAVLAHGRLTHRSQFPRPQVEIVASVRHAPALSPSATPAPPERPGAPHPPADALQQDRLPIADNKPWATMARGDACERA